MNKLQIKNKGVLGSPLWMSPEAVQGTSDVDSKSDIVRKKER